MADNVYECMFILDPNRYAREPSAVTGALGEMVEKCNGELLASRLWNEQKLAYPINGQRKGVYWLTYFRMDSARVAEFDRECRLNNNILRNLTLKIDPRLVDTLVAHARGEVLPTPPEPAPGPVSDDEATALEGAKATDDSAAADS